MASDQPDDVANRRDPESGGFPIDGPLLAGGAGTAIGALLGAAGAGPVGAAAGGGCATYTCEYTPVEDETAVV